jgi:hypothetical protein
MPTSQRAPTVLVYDNNLELDGHKIERMMAIMRHKDFLTGSDLLEDNSPMSYVLILFMAIDVLVVGFFWIPYRPFISKG